MGSSLACFVYLSTVLSHICFAQNLNCTDKSLCSSCDCSALQTCGGLFIVGGNGEFELPRGKGTSCMDCRWVFSVPHGRIRLTFSSFVLGPGDVVKVYDGQSSSSLLIVTYTDGDSPVDLISSRGNMTVTMQSDSCGFDPVLSGSYKPTNSGKLVTIFSNKRKARPERIRCPNDLKPNVEYLLAFVTGERRLISAKIELYNIVNGGPGDRVVVQKSLGKKSRNSRMFVGSRSARNWVIRTRDVPGFTISFTSRNGSCGRGFQLTVTSLSSVSSCLLPKSIPNGRVSFVNFGKKVKFSCCKGFKLIGTNETHCANGQWSASSTPLCTRVDSCIPPQNMKVLGKSPVMPLGSIGELSCNHGYKLSHSLNSLPSLCDCNGNLNISNDPALCQRNHCGPPPPPPTSGNRVEGKEQQSGLHVVGSVVNYTCPRGYDLDGVPYRVCTDSLTWEPRTSIHTCRAGYKVCRDPGIPQNGLRRAPSFGHGHMASFGCQRGFKREGSHLRVCEANDPINVHWTGVPVTCKSMFKSPEALALQLKEAFVDRTLSCTGEAAVPISSSTPAHGRFNITRKLYRPMDCRGRAVVIGEGCIDLIYVVDCSKSVGIANFIEILKFVAISSSLFDIDGGVARVTLITYDHNVYQHFQLGEKNTTNDTLAAIGNATFCAGATATSKVLKFVIHRVMPNSRSECKRAIFLVTDGLDNWSGDPKNEAKILKEEKNLEIYTIAFGLNINEPVLTSLASTSSHFFDVKHPEDMTTAIKQVFHTNIDYCQNCGIPLSLMCEGEANGVCKTRRGAWPWMTAIYRLQRNSPVFLCGGSIIGDCWILTAAHCLKDYKKENLLVVVGEHERFVDDRTEKTFSVEKVVIHSDYGRGANFSRDIGLLKLSCNITCSPYVRKGCLPLPEDKRYYEPETPCIVAGWGVIGKGNQDDVRNRKASIKELHLPIADNKTCVESTSPEHRQDVTKYTICAGDGSGQNDPCQGDSGGPLFCKRDGQDRYVIVGIVSWGEGCGQQDKYGMFTHLLNLVDWVHNEMAQHICEPPRIPNEAGNNSCPISIRKIV